MDNQRTAQFVSINYFYKMYVIVEIISNAWFKLLLQLAKLLITMKKSH